MVKRTKLLALLLGATMMAGSTVTAAAAVSNPTTGAVTAPIYNLNITDVVVPANLAMAFNPDGAEITRKSGDKTTNQVASLNYGIVHKSSQDKKVTVAFTVADQNSSQVTLATSEDEVTNAADNSYVLYLEAVPGTNVQVSGSDVTKDTDKTALADVTMTEDEDHAIVANGGKFEFVMGKATYQGKGGQTIDLVKDDAGSTSNSLSDKVEVKELGSNCSNVGFTFKGKMNTNTNWSKLSSGIQVSVTYTIDDIYNADSYGLVEEEAPVFTGGSKGVITYTSGSGSIKLGSISKIEMMNGGVYYDGYHSGSVWSAASDDGSTITIDTKFMNCFRGSYPSEAKITYMTYGTNGTDGVEKTVTIDLSWTD